MEYDKDLAARQEARALCRGALAAQKVLGGFPQEKLDGIVAAAKPGAGQQIMETLFTLMDGQVLRLQVASTNTKAIRLYERLGFRQTKEVSSWYRVFPLHN